MDLSFWASFFAGFTTFFTPCILPLVPVYMGFVTGFSVDELKEKKSTYDFLNISLRLLTFILGFTFVFVSLGATASFIGNFFVEYKPLLVRISGILIIIFGLYLLGVLRFSFLNTTKRLPISKSQNSTLFFPFVFGIAFGFGWSPCVGPILGSILLLASTGSTVLRGLAYLLAYSIGLAIPLFFVGIAFSSFINFLSKYKYILKAIDKIAGLILLIFGSFLLFGKIGLIYSLFGM